MHRPGVADILIVEDSADDLDLIMHAMRRGHFINTTVSVRDGVEAIEYLRQEGRYRHLRGQPPPRVVLLDIKLPMVSGVEVLQSIRADERTRTVPVVMMTSSAEDRDLQTCYQLGANSYVVKPVDVDQFFRAVQQIGLYWMIFNHPTQDPKGVYGNPPPPVR